MNANYRERLKDKKRIVIKIGSSSLIHSETGRLDFRKLEILARGPGQTDDYLSETFWRIQSDGGADPDDQEYYGQ